LPAGKILSELIGICPNLHPYIRAAVALSDSRADVESLACACGASPTTVRRTMRLAGLPSPAKALAWARALNVIYSLEQGVSQSPHTNDVGIDDGIRQRCDRIRHNTGQSPAAWLAHGGYAEMRAAFIRRHSTSSTSRSHEPFQETSMGPLQ
jgi:methylphosphotriester-DNA--protein-cysteine methyltransferase